MLNRSIMYKKNQLLIQKIFWNFIIFYWKAFKTQMSLFKNEFEIRKVNYVLKGSRMKYKLKLTFNKIITFFKKNPEANVSHQSFLFYSYGFLHSSSVSLSKRSNSLHESQSLSEYKNSIRIQHDFAFLPADW